MVCFSKGLLLDQTRSRTGRLRQPAHLLLCQLGVTPLEWYPLGGQRVGASAEVLGGCPSVGLLQL
jgi:hypothetical protein